MIVLADLFTSMLNPLQWALMLAVPPLIVMLYFLKLKRQPLEVPSTFLWHRTVEDLHVNSIWQKLRQNLLLFLQLLLLLLAILACLRPSWQDRKLTDDRYIFMIDTSASMNATDKQPTRLGEVKRQVEGLIDELESGDVAMLVSFSDQAIVEQSYTDDRRLLKKRLANIKATQRTSDLDEALRVAGGLANPGRSGTEEGDAAAAEAKPATMMIFSDGQFRTIPKFAMGNLNPIFVQIGEPQVNNVGVIAFDAKKTEGTDEKINAFARIQNFGAAATDVTVNLYLDGKMIDAANVSLEEDGGETGVDFTFDSVVDGELKLEIEQDDDFLLDNSAYAVVNRPQRGKVLLVTPGNDILATVLNTDQAAVLADVSVTDETRLTDPAHIKQAAAGDLDLIIYDRCAPAELPKSNTLFIGALPPGEVWSKEEQTTEPRIIDTDRTHPLMEFVQLGDIELIAQASPLAAPRSAKVLVDSDMGTLMAISPREGFEDVVLGIEIINDEGQVNTDWPWRIGFPVFFGNVLKYLSGGQYAQEAMLLKPGQSVRLRTTSTANRVTIQPPQGPSVRVERDNRNSFLFGQTDRLGIYSVTEEKSDKPDQRFAVNLFDNVESNIVPSDKISTTYEEIQAQTGWEPTRRDVWKFLLLCGLVVLLFEWYIFNRRVYL